MKKQVESKMDSGSAVSAGSVKDQAKKKWQKPKLEDVSGKVMAQPYIRFT